MAKKRIAVTVDGIEVSLKRKMLTDFRAVRMLYRMTKGGSDWVECMDGWCELVMGADEWQRVQNEFAASHDGCLDFGEFAVFVAELVKEANARVAALKN